MSRRPLLLETIEDRILCSAVPTASISAPAKPLIGEKVSLTATFDNTSATSTGFGPYVDVYLPATGADGAGAATDDGLTFVNGSATYLGSPVTTTVLTFDAAGHATHPYAKTNTGAPLVVTGTPGDQLVVFQLPFGSFTPSQPAASINFSAQLSNLADVGTPLNVQARAGFQYGNDALDNPTTDPSLVGVVTNTNITPSLFTLSTTYLGPENETATGPNFPRQYLINVDVATGQTLTNLDLTDVLPNNAQFVSVNATTINGSAASTTAISTPSTSIPGGTLTRRFSSVTGTSSTDDASMLFTIYIPRADSTGTAVIDPISGNSVLSIEDAKAQANWTPIDPRDPAGVVVSNDVPNDHTLTDKSIAIQKTVNDVTDLGAAGPSPGDTLEYTMTFQISDYFAFENLLASDVFSDGQKLAGGFTPTLTVNEHGTTTSGTFSAANYTLGSQNTTDGTTTLDFNISNELIARGLDGSLLGGNVPDGGTGGTLPQSAPALNPGTTATITFRTVIQDNFDYNYPSGDRSVDQGDVLSNNVTITGNLLSVSNVTTPTGQSESDTSSASVSIVKGTLTKTIYAINGNTSFTSPPKIAAGDTVTYRLTYTLPTSDVEGLTLSDFLPLPIFDATSLTTFDDVTSAAAPTAGHIHFGPSDTYRAYSGIVPTLSTDAVSNNVSITYPDFDDPRNQTTTVDLLLTVTASANPFADGLFLTNQAQVAEGTTNAGTQTTDAIVQLQLTEPVLSVTKGVVATDKVGSTFSPGAVGPVAFSAPGSAGTRFSGTINSNGLAATPINSNLSGIDAGDVVTFAIVVQNTGSGLNGAFDVELRDSLPAGFAIPASGLNLNVSDGTGAALGFSNLGSGLFDPAGGIAVTDPGSTNPDPGSLDRYDPINGRNVMVLTYDLVATSSVQPGQTLTNTATLFNYAGAEGGPDFSTTDLTDTATVTVATPTPSKSVVSTSESFTGNVAGVERAAIGEVVRYRLVTQLPEGSATNFRLVDSLPNGLTYLDDGTTKVAFVSSTVGSLTSSTLSGAGLEVAGDDSTITGITPTYVLPGASILGGTFSTGTDPTFVLGNLTNSDSDANSEYVVVEFNALVDNSVAGNNKAGNTRSNTYQASVNGSLIGPVSNAAKIVIAESALTLNKSVAPVTGDAGDTVTFTVKLTNGTGSNVTPAFDSQILDNLPSYLTLNVGSVSATSAGGVTGIVNNSAGSSVNYSIDTIPTGGSVTVTYSATINSNVTPGQVITNTAVATTTSLPGTNGTTSNLTGSANTGTPGADNGERTGSLVNENTLRTTSQSTVTIQPIVPVKSIVATSEPSTTGSNVAIGEVVRYRLQVQVPESDSLTNFALNDALPAGLTFLNDGTARVAFVGDSGGLTSSTLSGAGLYVVGSQTNVNGITPTFTLPGAAISGGPFSSGTDVAFNLGTIDNADRDPDQEFVVVEFNALVDNSAAGNTKAGNVLGNTFSVSLNGTQSGPASNVASVTVVEPSITDFTKTVSTPTGDAGDTVSYTVTYSNKGATAFDSRLTDTIPAFMTFNPASVSITLGGGASGITDASAGNSLDVTIASVPTGGTVSVTYTGILNANVTPGQVLTNGAQLVYSSLPGTNGTTGNATGSDTPGTPGSSTGERNGSGGLNNYSSATSANITVPYGSINKSITSTSLSSTSGSNVAIGETINYSLSVTLPEGSSPNTLVIDSLPAGLAYVAGSASLNTTNFGGTVSLNSVTNSGGSLSFDLGNATVTNDNNTGNNVFTINYSAIVQNVAGNEGILPGQTSLPNSATLQVNGGAIQSSNVASATVIEPQLQITKTLLNGDTTVDAGTVMHYKVVIQHTAASTGPAFDIALSDALASIGLGIDLSSLTITPSYNGAANGYLNVTDNSNANGLALTLNRLDLGDTVTITYSATVSLSPAPGSAVTNTASLTAYDTLPGGGRVEAAVNSSSSFTINTNAIAGYVYCDLNNNAKFDEAAGNGLQNVPVRLLFAGADGTFGDGDDVTYNTLTAADGSYQFSGLRPGKYQLLEVSQPVGLLDGQEQAGNAANPFGGTAGPIGSDLISGIVIPADSNQSQPNYNFGELPPATLGDFVWQDLNGNGRQDAGEPGLSGVNVTLSGTNDLGAIAPIIATSAADGSYQFTNLRPGSYHVTFSNLPIGAELTVNQSAVANSNTDSNPNPNTGVTPAVTLVAGQSDLSVDAGIFVPITIGDRVWYDVNGNGVQDAGEPGIVGATVTATWAGPDGLLGTADDVAQPVATTGANGNWSIGNLPPGNYKVTVSNAPSGLTLPTYDEDGIATPSTVALTLVSGGNRSDIDFGYRGAGSIGDFVWNDTNGNGVQDAGEPGLPSAAVTLTWFGQDGVLGGGDDVVFNTSSNAAGAYQFANLPSGSFSVAINPASIPSNLTPTFDLDGAGTPNSTRITLAPGQARTDADFGYQGNASVGNTVWYDLNANGVRDADETGIAGATVTLTFGGLDGNLATAADNISYSTSTDANGDYLFQGLPVAINGALPNYRVTVGNIPAVYSSPIFDLDGTGTPNTTAFQLANSQNKTDVDFGYRGNNNLSGYVYSDTSNDGIFQSGGSVPESGIAGVTLTLSGTDYFGNVITRTTVSAANGSYLFTGLIAGNYSVAEQPQNQSPLDAFLDGKDTSGSTGGDATSSNDRITSIPLSGGGTSSGNNFGELAPSSLAGSVFIDANGDGVRGPSEKGITGVTITLSGTDDLGQSVSQTLLTDSNGDYHFVNLRPGTYSIAETQPSGYLDGQDAVGTTGGTLGNDEVDTIALAAGEDGVSYTFGERRTSLSGTVFIDQNKDGVLDPTDNGRIGGVILTLHDAGGSVVASAQTDASGNYVFGDLVAGDYTLEETQPNGYGSSSPDAIQVTIPVEGLAGANFGETTGSLSGRVYLDADRSGDFSSGDSGLGGVLISLSGTDANGVAISRTTSTGPDGTYSFDTMVSGTYILSETQPIAYRDGAETVGSLGGTLIPSDTIGSISLPAATDGTDYNFGELTKPSPGNGLITGNVFADLNRNGILDGGENGLAGVTLRLSDSNGVIIATTTTDQAGAYAFKNLTPGNYSVIETQPTAYGSSTPNTLSSVSVTAGAITANQNFGETYANLAGTVYLDANNDGHIDAGEARLGGVTIRLTGTDVNGSTINRTTVTGLDGAYSFGNLLNGIYTLSETQPVGYADGIDTIGTSGGVLGNDVFSTIGLGGGVQGSGYNFGERGATLSGNVFLDSNRNAVLNAGETGLSGVSLLLQDSQGNIVASTTTASDGTYSFSNLIAGSYSVTETQPNGYGSSSPDAVSVNVPVSGAKNVNFADTTASLSGMVYLDSNNDGSYSAGEKGIGNTTISLTGTDANGAQVALTTTTGSNGLYSFTGLLSGNYTLTETQPPLYSDGSESVGTAGVLVLNNDQFGGIGLGAGIDATDYQFGETLPTHPGKGTIVGTIFVDRNKDGTLESGEHGLGGIAVTLLDSLNNIVATTSTASDGTYAFTNVTPANGYQVIEPIQPNGYGSSTPNNVNGINVLGDDVNVVNFGETASSLGGFAYLDKDGDHKLSSGDLPIGGVTLSLQGMDVNGNSVTITTLTASDGSYQFSDLVAGTYSITETQPSGLVDGADTVGSKGGTLVSPDTISTITIPAATDATGYNFGETGLSLNGKVFVDLNKNGVVDESGTGIGGVAIQLVDVHGTVVGSTMTASDGSYTFANLLAGNYSVVETQPAGYGSSTPNDVDVTLTSGNSPQTVNLGETTGSISGSVYHDLNNDGLMGANEPGIANTTVTLTGVDVDGNPVSQTTTTLPDGSYRFTGLLTGTYTLKETQPAGYQQGRDSVGSVGGNASVTDVISGIGIGGGNDESGYLFGERTASDLVVTKSDGVTRLQPGNLVTYRITIHNPALQDADGVLVVDQFPSNVLNFVSASNGGVFDPSTGTIRWNAGVIAGSNSQTVTLTVTARVKATIPAGVELTTNSVTVTDTGNPGSDLNPANNTARDTDRVIAAPDLYVFKTDNLLTTTVGATDNYTISAGNAGNQTASGVIIRDTLPAGVKFVSATAGGRLVNGEVVWNVGTLQPGQTVRLNVEVVIEKVPAGGLLVNNVTIADQYGNFEDATPWNNRASDETNVKPLFVPPSDSLAFAFDSFHDFAAVRKTGYFNYTEKHEIYPPPLLPLMPVYSGEADPGATLFISLVNARGVTIGEQTVMVDAGGNWLATFPSSAIRDVPSSVRITELPAPYSIGEGTGFNLRTYFSPALNPGHFFTESADSTLLGEGSAPLLGDLGLENPLGLGDVKYGGELLGTQATASGN